MLEVKRVATLGRMAAIWPKENSEDAGYILLLCLGASLHLQSSISYTLMTWALFGMHTNLQQQNILRRQTQTSHFNFGSWLIFMNIS